MISVENVQEESSHEIDHAGTRELNNQKQLQIVVQKPSDEAQKVVGPSSNEKLDPLISAARIPYPRASGARFCANGQVLGR